MNELLRTNRWWNVSSSFGSDFLRKRIQI